MVEINRSTSQPINKLPVFDRVSLTRQYIVLDIDPECEDHIQDDRRAHGKEGDIDKPHPYTGRGNTQFFANGCTNAKGTHFEELSDLLHN